MRLFTAIPLPQETKDKFTAIARGRLPIPYVNASNLHITLNFLGEADTDRTGKVLELWESLPAFPRLRIEFDRLVKFRSQIHMTLKPNQQLEDMQGRLAQAFSKLGFQPTYPRYYAHVTVGNLHMDKVMYKDRKVENFPHQELAQLAFQADRIVLFESKLLLHHAKHIPLAERALA